MIKKYNIDSIVKLSQRDAVRKTPEMYIRNVETPTRLLEEIIDNSLDEVQSGFCTCICIYIDTKTNIISVSDNGRGIPFNKSLPIEKDPPILAATQLLSSGKFNKSENGAYKVSIGLHGVGLAVTNFLSDFMKIEIIKENRKATYNFEDGMYISRTISQFPNKNIPYSTKVTFKPLQTMFQKMDIDLDSIEERIRLACAIYPKLSILLSIDGKEITLRGDVNSLILNFISKDITEWKKVEIKKGEEELLLYYGWDDKVSSNIFSSVNLSRVHTGVHINKLQNIIKNIFSTLSKKDDYKFDLSDSLVGFKAFLSLKIINTSFESQVKISLGSKSDISIMDNLENIIRKDLDADHDFKISLMEKFQSYRRGLQAKKIVTKSSKKRSSSELTKLKDCRKVGGELIIGEGDSAIDGISLLRDMDTQAVLPLRGVIANSITKKDILKNSVVKELISALGCGTYKECDVSKLRYDKIFIATDADPAGDFISCLCIVLFADIFPDIIKAGKLFLIETPLRGYGEKDDFVPIWTKDEEDKARKLGKKIRYFKGLGSYDKTESKKFILDKSKRKTIQIKWYDNVDKLFELVSSSKERRKLAIGEWSGCDE